MKEVKVNTCPEIPFFGAKYPDATCIDGFLWDLDSCDEPGGSLTQGGDVPCPFCNRQAFKEYYNEEEDAEITMTQMDVWIDKMINKYKQ